MEKVMDVKNIPIKEIVPYAKNAKKHDKRQNNQPVLKAGHGEVY